ncbi:hypothetical protein B0T16DRAFT_136313 [Cercophora newfieldiana]|uniref:F-box domain-containing protein n=1 Tax=Cercophora newfieldiana TaxID=92897 RepID=A0AA39YD78_9PEZI|nr:hypothetical protein B0T16DRAFT_136313 [Cercophora newfieldiana]
MDPLVARSFHNVTRSPLCRLPEELLLKIMTRLAEGDSNLQTLQNLRSTSRLFLRLSYSPELRHGYPRTSPKFDPNEHFRPWPAVRIHPVASPHWMESLCSVCKANNLKFRGLNVGNSAYCHHCREPHHSAYFCNEDRQRVGRRLCIADKACVGYSGAVRLCKHKSIRWRKSWLQLGEADPRRLKLLSCDDPSHIPGHHDDGFFRTSGDNLAPSVFIEVIKSHLGKREVWVKQLLLEWTGHMRLPDHGDCEEGRQFTSIEMARLLEDFRQDAARFIVPRSTPDCLPEMRCFDPSRCSCLYYPGEESVPGGWHRAPLQSSLFQSCRADPALRLPALAPNSQDSAVPAQGKIGSHTSRTVLGAAFRPVGSGPSSFQRVYGTTITIDPCADNSRCLRITYQRIIPLYNSRPGRKWPPVEKWPRVVPQPWFEAVDPDSHRGFEGAAREQHDGLWCGEDPSCPNYYQYLERPLLRECGRKLCELQPDSREWLDSRIEYHARKAKTGTSVFESPLKNGCGKYR